MNPVRIHNFMYSNRLFPINQLSHLKNATNHRKLCSVLRTNWNIPLNTTTTSPKLIWKQWRTFSVTMELNNQNTCNNDIKLFEIDYNELIKAQKDAAILIVDVREDHEIAETGKLPGSIHIPMGNTVQDLTNLSEEKFEQKYSKSKPHKTTKIIFSCRSGRRSGMVQEDMQKLGYKNVFNYGGGWLDWESKQKQDCVRN